MNSFFRRIFCCTAAKPTSPATGEHATSRPSRQPAANRTSVQARASQQHHERRRSSASNQKPVKKYLKIKTAFTTQDIRVTETRSEETHDLKYHCPICFRYFDHIMISSCCKNYLCHFCAEDINERIRKDDKVHTARCSFCDAADFYLLDVDPNERPKKYTDSFYSSFKSNGKGAFFATNRKLFQNTIQGPVFDANAEEPQQLQSPLQTLKDPRSASDGAIYMKRALEENAALTRTFNSKPVYDSPSQDRSTDPRELENVIRNTEYTPVEFRRSQISHQEGVESDDSLNQREPIDVIKEDEFESSMMPESGMHQPHNN